MKNTKMVQVFFIIICLLSYLVGAAQTDYVVTTKGDTIKGKTKFLNFDSGKKVQVTTLDGKKSDYPVLQTLAISMQGENYVPVRFEQNYVYMKVLKSGYLSLYAFQLPNQTMWDGRYMLKKDGKGIEVPNLVFKKQVSQFLSGCPALASRIELKELTKADINEIIDLYNSCIAGNTDQLMSNQPVGKVEFKNLAAWETLEAIIKQSENFNGKTTALEMITEVKAKISKGETVPNFLIEGLKNTLKDQASPKEFLEKALEVKP